MNNIDNLFKKLPCEIINIILEYDGHIKYKNRKYVNIIHKNDNRYNIITPIINKKIEILQNIEDFSKNSFYFEFTFEKQPMLALCYYYDKNVFEICYTDMKESGHILGSNQIRTIYN
tara:strand:+ start:1444 stop:1794 length:351 start_codon:yes stop_codon:yes gene_type:complete